MRQQQLADTDHLIGLSHPCDGQPKTVPNFFEKSREIEIACVEMLLRNEKRADRNQVIRSRSSVTSQKNGGSWLDPLRIGSGIVQEPPFLIQSHKAPVTVSESSSRRSLRLQIVAAASIYATD
jgi:hypothetical protein